MTPLQKQAQQTAAKLAENKAIQQHHADDARQQRQRTEARQSEQRRQSGDKPRPIALPKPQPKMLLRSTESPERTRRTTVRDRNTSASERASPKRPAINESVARQEASLFSELLEEPASQTLAIAGSQFGFSQGMASSDTQTTDSRSPAMKLWYQLEPELGEALAEQPDGPLSLTLLLPKLGEVDARMARLTTGPGWDISLGFAPEALEKLSPYHDRCRESLRRRMACRVRLSFERRG